MEALHSLGDYSKKKVMIMFSVVRDGGARMTTSTINHSVEAGLERGDGFGVGGSDSLAR